MANFMYLFRGDQAALRSMSPEEMQQVMKKWMDWREALKKTGHIKNGGNRLDAAGRIVRGKTKAVTDGPYVEAKDSVAGYMLVEAKDIDQAVALAKGCPILESDGTLTAV